MVQTRKSVFGSILLVVLISLSLRSPMATVGPMSSQFQADLGLSAFAAGFVTTIPMITFSAMAPVAGRIVVAAECKKLMTGCFGLSTLGVVLRSFGGVVGLYLGTTFLGLAIGTLNVLMPALIRRQFPDRIGLIMGCYLTAQTAASSIFSGICQNIALDFGGWRMGLAAPGVLCLVSVAACLFSGKLLAVRLETQTAAASRNCITRKHIAVALYMGIQSFFYFSMVAWLPSIAEALVPVSGASGMLLLIMQACGLIPCLLMPSVTQRVRRRDLLAFFGAFLFVLSFGCMALCRGSYNMILLGAVFSGFGCSGTLSLSLTIIAGQGDNAAETAKISAMSQCIGYALAAFGPTGLGLLYDCLGRWEPVLICLIVMAVGMTLLGLYAGRREEQNDGKRK